MASRASLSLEDPTQVIAVPPSLGRLGVLAEPMSVCARALRHALAIGGRQPWQLERALVIGAGAIGMLSTLLLRLHGVDVWTASLEPSNELVEGVGAPLRRDRRRRRWPAGARRLRRRDRSGGERAADGDHARPPASKRRRLPARHRSARADRRARRADARRSTRSSRTASSSAASTPSDRTGSQALPHSTRPASAGRTCSSPSSACACRSTASREAFALPRRQGDARPSGLNVAPILESGFTL